MTTPIEPGGPVQPAGPQPFVDPETGLQATQHDGRVWFNSGGKYFSASSVSEGLQHDPTATLATPAEVQQRLIVREQDTAAGQAKIATKQLASHAFDVATGIVRYPAMGLAALTDNRKALNEIQQLGGEQVLENVYGIVNELAGQGNQEQAGRQYHEATKAQAEANPGTAEVAGIVGDIVPTLATGGLAAAGKVTGGLASERLAGAALGRLGEGALAKAGTHALAGAIQGVGFGMQAASEASYLSDDPLTRQKVWAAGAMGGLLGGGIAGGVSLLGSGARAALRPKLSSIAGPVPVVPKSSLAEALGDSTVTRDAAQDVADRAMAAEGVPAAPGLGEKLHSLLTDIQSSATGAEKEAVGKYGLGAILDPKTRVAALDGIRIFRERPQIIEGASSEIADSMGLLQQHADNGVFQEVRDLGMKRNAWEKLVDPAKRGEQVDAARAFVADTRSKLEGMLAEAPEPGASTAEAGVSDLSNPEAVAGIRKAFGRDLSSKEVDDLVGYSPDLFQGGEPKLTVSPVENGFKVEAQWTKDGEDLANIHRTFTRDANGNLRVHHNVFDINENLQGNGIGSEVMARQLRQYEKAGVSGIDLEATWDGPYVWSKAGFDVADAADLKAMRKRFADFLEGSGEDVKLARRAKTANDIANVSVDGEPYGKDFLRAYYGEHGEVPMTLDRSGFKKTLEYFDSVAARHPREPVAPVAAAAAPAVEQTAFGDLKRVKSLLGHVKKTESLLAGDIGGADAAIELDALKRNLGKLTKGTVRKLDTLEKAGDFEADAVRNTARTLSDTYEGLRQHLMNEDMWGKAGAAQKEINQGWQDWIDSRSVYSSTLMRRTGSEGTGEFGMWDTRPRFEVDPNKVGSWIDQFGTGRGKLNDKYVQAHVDATDKLTSAIGKYVDTGTAADSVAKVRAAVQKIQTQLGVARETVAVANQVQLVGGAQMGTAAKLGMASAGAMLGGPVGAALGFVLSPGKVMHAAMTIQGLLAKVDTEKKGLISSFFEKAGQKAKSAGKAATAAAQDAVYTEGLNATGAAAGEGTTSKATKRAATAAGLKFFGGSSPQAQSDSYQKRREQLAMLSSSPQLMAEQTANVLGPLGGIAPQLAASFSLDATRNLQMLQQMAPPATPIGGLFAGGRRTFTPQADIAKFAHQWEGVMNPLSVLRDLNNGSLNVDKVTAARAAHPELFADIAAEFLARASTMKTPMNHQAALQADLLLGLNGAGEPSVAPAFLARIATLNEADQADQRSPPQARPPVNLAKNTATLSQSLEGA